ncbi:MAG: hypothetical protein KJ607_10275 [Bacteroidetes bacterium]|nr:hypothetical protein [Bacteroidota bacterium]
MALFLLQTTACILPAVSAGIAQTGIFYYELSNETFPNTGIVDMTESTGNELLLLGASSDEGYSNPQPFYARIGSKGEMIINKTFETSGLYNLNDIILLKDGSVKIFGSEQSGGIFRPYTKSFDKNGESETSEATLTFNSTLTGDACKTDESHIVVAQTVMGSNGYYNISVYKYDTETAEQVWFKKLKAESHEEANKLHLLGDSSILVAGKLYNDELTSYTSVIYKLSPDGEEMGKIIPSEVAPAFKSQAVTSDNNGEILYISSYMDQENLTSMTQLLKLNPEGKVTVNAVLENIIANGIMRLQNGNFLIYGCHLRTEGMSIVTKSKILILNTDLKIISEYEMSLIDRPDSELPSLAMTMQPTSSDFMTAIQMKDGRIACAGRLYMPVQTDPDSILTSPRYNRPYLVLFSDKGMLDTE